MRYRLSTLIWSVFGFALAICLVRLMPMFSLASLLLLPFPALAAVHWNFRRNSVWALRHRRLFFLGIVLSAMLFYVGMSGPLFAIFALPDHFPLVADRPWLRACAGWIYTPLSWIENHFGDRHLLSEYQYWWLRLMMVLVEVPQQS